MARGQRARARLSAVSPVGTGHHARAGRARGGDRRAAARRLRARYRRDGAPRADRPAPGPGALPHHEADRVVPAEQVQALREAILSFLEASRLDMVDKPKALVEFSHALALEAALPEPSRTYMDYVNHRDVVRLGPVLLPHVVELGSDS